MLSLLSYKDLKSQNSRTSIADDSASSWSLDRFWWLSWAELQSPFQWWFDLRLDFLVFWNWSTALTIPSILDLYKSVCCLENLPRTFWITSFAIDPQRTFLQISSIDESSYQSYHAQRLCSILEIGRYRFRLGQILSLFDTESSLTFWCYNREEGLTNLNRIRILNDDNVISCFGEKAR